jgi:hypothetical protein
MHGRMTRRVAFELPITEAAIDFLLEHETGYTAPSELPRFAVDDQTLAAIDSEVDPSEYVLMEGDVGRGASGYGVAFELIGRIADVGGVIAFGGAAIATVRRLHQKISERLGRPPLVSLGAACYLAAADFVDRFGTHDFELHGMGDTRLHPPDSAYTGNDCFFVIFQREHDLYFYAVDAYGKTTYLSTVEMPHWW